MFCEMSLCNIQQAEHNWYLLEVVHNLLTIKLSFWIYT